MQRIVREGAKRDYCILGPHRLPKNANKVGSNHLRESFKAYVGNTWEDFKDDDKVCSACHSKICNLGTKLGIRKKKQTNSAEPLSEDDISTVVSTQSTAVSEESGEGLPDNIEDPMEFEMIEFDQPEDVEVVNDESDVSSVSQLSSVSSSSTRPVIKYSLENVSACTSGHQHCVVCRTKLTGDYCRHRVPKAVIYGMWKDHHVFIPEDVRACKDHHDGESFSEDAVKTLLETRASKSCSAGQKAFFEWIQEVTKSRDPGCKYHFGEDGVAAEDYPAHVGLTKDQFDDLFTYVDDHMRNSCNRSKRDALAIWLSLMKSSSTQEHLALDFNMDQPTISRICQTVGDLVYEHFTKKHIGFKTFSREDVASHSTKTACISLGIPEGSVVVIADGTYLYIDKPVNHAEQRLTFSGQKNQNFLRMMMITALDGHILASIGPFAATWNDAKCMKWILENTDLIEFMGEDGHILLDRGFRDCEAVLKTAGITTHSPEWRDKSERQLSTEQAGNSRLVTMNRWTVEAANGRVKQKFRFFLRKIYGRYSPKIPIWFESCCAILNKYSKPAFTETERNVELATIAVERSLHRSNPLFDRLESSGRLRLAPKKWQRMSDEDLGEFPLLTFEQMQEYTVGSYQLSEAQQYISEHKKVDGRFEIRMHAEEEGLVRTQIHSRFQSAVTHSAFVEFIPGGVGDSAILDHCCTCVPGKRKVGCCVHVTTVIRYLSYDRHSSVEEQRKSKRVKFLGLD